MTVLVIAEHNNANLKKETAKIVNAALQVDANVNVLIAGHNCQSVADEAAKLDGVKQVFLASNPAYAHFLADNFAELILSIAEDYSHIFAAASNVGKDVMPRVAALLDVNQLSEITKIIDENTFIRPIYAGNALATVKSLDDKKVATIRASAFDDVATTNQAEIVIIDTIFESKATFVSQDITASTRPELTSAPVVISGGRGVGSADNFSILMDLADKLGGAVGASRAAVDAGFISNDLQVGQTGKVVAPDLYIAAGISGAIQHLAGMKDAKVIVAINKDPDAPIFQVADYGIVADLFEVLPAITAAIE